MRRAVRTVDINADLGEGFGCWRIGTEEGLDTALLSQVTSANIACGWHAGDPLIMDKTIKECKKKGVAAGAHPGCPDLLGFGRRSMAVSPEEASAYMLYQAGALQAFAHANGVPLQHIKLHGAFYNAVCVTPALADAVLSGLEAFDPAIRLTALSGSYIAKEGKRRGLRITEEVFADRGVAEDGTLIPRGKEGAFIREPAEALSRILQMINKGTVITVSGKEIEITADSVCVHGDNPEALTFATEIRSGLEREGIRVANFLERA